MRRLDPRHVLNVVRGDLWPLIRDRAYLKKLVLAPLLIIPLTLLATPLALRMAAKDTATAPAVLVVDKAHPLPPELERVLAQGLPSARGFIVEPVDDPEVWVTQRKAPVGLRYTPDRIEVIARQTTIGGAGMLKRLATLLSYYQAQAAGDKKVAGPQVVIRNAATPAERALGGLAFLIPMVVVIWLLNTVENTALEISAEHREKGLIEALLLTPASRESIAAGKVLAAGAVGAAASLMAWLALVLTGILGRFLPADDTTFSDIDVPIGGQVPLTLWGAVGFLVVMVTLGLFFSSFILWFGFRAKSARDARAQLTFLGMGIILAGLGLQFADTIATQTWPYLVPVLGGVVAILESAKATITPLALTITAATNLALSAAFAFFAARALISGRAVLGESTFKVSSATSSTTSAGTDLDSSAGSTS